MRSTKAYVVSWYAKCIMHENDITTRFPLKYTHTVSGAGLPFVYGGARERDISREYQLSMHTGCLLSVNQCEESQRTQLLQAWPHY